MIPSVILTCPATGVLFDPEAIQPRPGRFTPGGVPFDATALGMKSYVNAEDAQQVLADAIAINESHVAAAKAKGDQATVDRLTSTSPDAPGRLTILKGVKLDTVDAESARIDAIVQAAVSKAIAGLSAAQATAAPAPAPAPTGK